MSKAPWASVIATIRDEPVDRLNRMLGRVAAQQTAGPVEVLLAVPPAERAVVDDLRPSGTVARIIAVENPGGARSAGLNRAAESASAPIVHRVDARSLLAPDHLMRCDARLRADARVSVVGGRQHPVSVSAGTWAQGMARALANPLAVGAPAYRRAGGAGPTDTVYLGAFWRNELLEIGGYDERLEANEDFDLCQRFRAAGKLAWLEEGLVVDYEARSGAVEVWRQYTAFGRAKVRYWRLQGARPNARQVAGLLAPVGVAVATTALARRPRHRFAVAGLGAAVLGAFDHLGGDGPAPIGVRAAAAVGEVLIPTAWAMGAYLEAGDVLRDWSLNRRPPRTSAVAALQATPAAWR
jgi:hypothetical protein